MLCRALGSASLSCLSGGAGGDYIYIPANVLHVVVNMGEKPAVCIGTRNEPTAQESVMLYPEMDARVP